MVKSNHGLVNDLTIYYMHTNLYVYLGKQSIQSNYTFANIKLIQKAQKSYYIDSF